MKYCQGSGIKKENFITNIKVSKKLKDTYVLTYAKGKKRNIPISLDNSKELEEQLQNQARLSYENKKYQLENISDLNKKLVSLLIGNSILLLSDSVISFPTEIEILLSLSNIGISTAVIATAINLRNASKSYQEMMNNNMLLAYLEDEEYYRRALMDPEIYNYLDGDSISKKERRAQELLQLSEQGRLPASLLEQETGQGMTISEIERLYWEGRKSPAFSRYYENQNFTNHLSSNGVKKLVR